MMKLDRLTAALATLALASLCVAQRAYGQTTVNCGNPQVGTDLVLGATLPSTCLVTNTVSVTLGKYARLSIDNTNTTLTTPQASDFGTPAGVTTTGPTLTVSSNAPWTLTASTAAAVDRLRQQREADDGSGGKDRRFFRGLPLHREDGRRHPDDAHVGV